MTDTARQDVTPGGTPGVFEQPALVPRGAIGMIALWALIPVAVVVLDPGFGLRELVYGWVVVVGIAVVAAIATLPQTHRSVRVDAQGLHVKGRLEVPARRIGRVEVLRGGAAATWSWPASRPRGRARPRLPSRQNLYGGLYGWGPAVAVEVVDRDDPTVWLLPSRDPSGLAACLERTRDGA